MNSILQFVGTFASIFSIPLAIILYFKTNDARQNKIRLEIIRSLSYRIGEGKSLDKMEVSAVYNSKMREHNIKKSFFSEKTILEDIIADVISNPFLTSDQRTPIIENLGKTLQIYNALGNKIEQKGSTAPKRKKPMVYKLIAKHITTIDAFSFAATLLSVVITVVMILGEEYFAEFFSKYQFIGDNFVEFFSKVQFSSEILISIIVTFLAAVLVFATEKIIRVLNRWL